jgi:hypothetical protein
MTRLTTAQRSARYRSKDVEAYRKKKAAYARTPEQREKRTAYMQKWREENREKFNEMCRRSHNRARLNRTPEERHDQHLRSWYGVDRAWYLSTLEEQRGCAICGSITARWEHNFHVDHCHETHKIRGLLCNRCNPMLGWLEKYEVEVLAYLSQDFSKNTEVRAPSKNKSAKRDSV